MFAIVSIQDKQYKVTTNDVIITDRLPVDQGCVVFFKKILLLGTPTHTIIGRPFIQTATVQGYVVEHTKTARLWILKKKRRKNNRKLRSSSSKKTIIRIGRLEL